MGFCVAVSFNPASPVVSALIALSFPCSNEHTVVSDPALGQPISRTVKKFPTPAATVLALPRYRAGRLGRVHFSLLLPELG